VSHPVRIAVTDDLRRSRPTVLLRLLLVVPHYVWLSIWSWAALAVVVFEWLWALFAGRIDEDAHRWLARFLRYHVHVSAYVFLLANAWPRFDGRPGYAVDLEVDAAAPQSRGTVAFRAVLAIPAFVLASVLGTMLAVIAVAGWVVALALGRMPAGMEELGAYCLRYQAQAYAYLFLLTSRYPALSAPELRAGR
jgi:uncharacterized protein DUF4389